MKHGTQRVADRRSSRRFPISAEIRYAITGEAKLTPLGHARALNISSSGLLFAAAEGDKICRPGEQVQIRVAWPARLNEAVDLELWVAGRVVRCSGTLVAVSIMRYEFRTAKSLKECSLGIDAA